MGVDAERSLRISTGWSTIDADVERFGTAFAEAVAALRALRAADARPVRAYAAPGAVGTGGSAITWPGYTRSGSPGLASRSRLASTRATQ